RTTNNAILDHPGLQAGCALDGGFDYCRRHVIRPCVFEAPSRRLADCRPEGTNYHRIFHNPLPCLANSWLLPITLVPYAIRELGPGSASPNTIHSTLFH